MPRRKLTQSLLQEALRYDPCTGHFTWIKGRTGTAPGRRAGWVADSGHICIGIDRRTYKAHRLAWLYMTGAWPVHEIDHKNNVPADNRFANLREATDQQNSHNRRTRCDNVSGLKGVCFRKDKKERPYQALICIGLGKKRSLGFYRTPQEAHAAYAAAARTHHGEFARLA